MYISYAGAHAADGNTHYNALCARLAVVTASKSHLINQPLDRSLHDAAPLLSQSKLGENTGHPVSEHISSSYKSEAVHPLLS